MDQIPDQGGGQAPPIARRSRRPWLWVGVVIATALAVWVYTRVSTPSAVGTWSNRATENQITLTFNDDGSGFMTIGTARLDYRYRFERDHTPIWLDLDASVEGRSVTIRAIAEFARGDRLKIRMFHKTPNTRPTEFIDTDVDDTILLTRVEPAS